ncbi:ribonuclease III [Ruminococcus sp. AF41-9]|jgi:ribonuclease-3 family protein|nr:ribonuclease III [Ruminococcus sp. AF41-9]
METGLTDMTNTNDSNMNDSAVNNFNFGELKKGFHEAFHLEEKDLRTYSPLTLAYIGDGVYELVIRTVLVKKGNCPVNQLHRKASSLVKAASQSAMMEFIEPMLTEEEHSVYRRGRNAHSPTMAKHATMADYRRATGFEALMGYLYLKEDFGRIVELVRAGIREDQI